MIAKVRHRNSPDDHAQTLQSGLKIGGQAIAGLPVRGGGFDMHQLPDSPQYTVCLLFKFLQ
jgi:hypothetical protein